MQFRHLIRMMLLVACGRALSISVSLSLMPLGQFPPVYIHIPSHTTLRLKTTSESSKCLSFLGVERCPGLPFSGKTYPKAWCLSFENLKALHRFPGNCLHRPSMVAHSIPAVCIFWLVPALKSTPRSHQRLILEFGVWKKTLAIS